MKRVCKIRFLDNRGIAVVWLGLGMLFVLLAFAGLAIDIAYMYNVKNQLQVAADAAALAGAANLDGTNSLVQATARSGAVNFAGKNSAAGRSVVLASDGSNSLTNSNDITIGNWDPAQSPVYLAGRLPVNAIEVRARRTSNSPGGPTGVFLGQIFRLIGSDWSFMNAASFAVGSRPLRASSFIALGSTACSAVGCSYPSTCSFSSGMPGTASYAARCVAAGNPYPCCTGPGVGPLCIAKAFQAEPTSFPDDQKFAWTSLLEVPGSSSEFSNRMCNQQRPDEALCGTPGIYGLSGSATNALRDLESLMFDPTFDATHKEFYTSSTGTRSVIYWQSEIPQNTSSDPMFGPDPHPVIGYVKVRLVAVCAPGTAGCKGYDSPPGLCSILGLTGGGGGIAIDQIQCIPCGSPDLGPLPVLVRRE